MTLYEQFNDDEQGKKFADVLNDGRIDFEKVVGFFESEARQRRMIESELHHDRPALAGVVKELEALPALDKFFSGNDGHTTMRFRQAVGVLARIIMSNHGWQTTGRKGSLGTRTKTAAHSTEPGAYRNDSGLAHWFSRGERYELPPESAPDAE